MAKGLDTEEVRGQKQEARNSKKQKAERHKEMNKSCEKDK